MPILTATFDVEWAAVDLVVDGALWPSTVDRITITRAVPGEPDVTMRGVESREVVGGTFVGSDHEAPLESSVTYTVDGYLGATFVSSASATVSTAGAAAGLWLKAAGTPTATVNVRMRVVSEVSSPTIGGVYQIAGGGGSVAQTTTQWSGIESDRATVSLSTATGSGVARLRAILALSRVLLLQPQGSSDLDAGWYYVADVRRGNPAQMESYGRRWFDLDVQRTGVPAGDGSGIAGWSWSAVLDTYATCTDLLAARATCFDLLKGA